MWPCCDFTSSDDDEHNTDSNFLLLFADIGIMPTLLDGLTDVDVLHIALAADLPWTYLLSHSIILLPLSSILSLTTLSSFYFERCSHIDVLSSLPANCLALCGFSCLEYCVHPSLSVISRTLWRIVKHVCYAFLDFLSLSVWTHNMQHCFASLTFVLAIVSLCSQMEGHQNVSSSTGPSELNHSYYIHSLPYTPPSRSMKIRSPRLCIHGPRPSG